MNKEYTLNKTNDMAIKDYQLERWSLSVDDFPMDMAEFEFTDESTKVTIFGIDGNELFNQTFAPFDFDEAPNWLREILMKCNVISK